MRWISDLTNKEIGEEIERLCKLADLQLPELPKETAEFIKGDFGKWQSDVLRRAFDHWIGGNIPVTAYAKANANFISKVLKAFIAEYRHKLKYKPRPIIEEPKPIVKEKTPEEKHQHNLNTIEKGREAWVEGIKNRSQYVFVAYPYLMVVYSALEDEGLLPSDALENEIERCGQMYKNYRLSKDRESLRNAPTEIKRASIQKIIDNMGDKHINYYKVGMVGLFYETNP